MTTATQVIDQARGHLGDVGGGFAHEAFGLSGAWCAMAACTILRDAGVPADQRPWTAWTPNLVKWARERGRWKTTDPRPGDLVLFFWPGVSPSGRGVPPVCHVGIVEVVYGDRSLITLEGNTSGTISGSQYNGNVFARRQRSGSSIVGFVDMQPSYTPARPVRVLVGTTLASLAAVLGLTIGQLQAVNPGSTPDTQVTAGQVIEVPEGTVVDPTDPVQEVTPAPPAAVEPDPVEVGSAVVRDQQTALNRAGYHLVVDGIFGPKTRAATIDAQRRCHLVRDGIYGPLTTRCVASMATPVTVTSTSVITRNLSVGSTGAQVAGVQKALNRHGYSLKVDGVFGPRTAAAVLSWQRTHGLARDHVVGRYTTRSLGLTWAGR